MVEKKYAIISQKIGRNEVKNCGKTGTRFEQKKNVKKEVERKNKIIKNMEANCS